MCLDIVVVMKSSLVRCMTPHDELVYPDTRETVPLAGVSHMVTYTAFMMLCEPRTQVYNHLNKPIGNSN